MPGIEYINKQTTSVSSTTPVRPNYTNGLNKSCVKMDRQGVSIQIIHPTNNNVVHHILLKNVVSWNIDKSSLVIEQVDNDIPLILDFINDTEAREGEIRFTSIFNGNIIV